VDIKETIAAAKKNIVNLNELNAMNRFNELVSSKVDIGAFMRDIIVDRANSKISAKAYDILNELAFAIIEEAKKPAVQDDKKGIVTKVSEGAKSVGNTVMNWNLSEDKLAMHRKAQEITEFAGMVVANSPVGLAKGAVESVAQNGTDFIRCIGKMFKK
jgi:hypothetical protein